MSRRFFGRPRAPFRISLGADAIAAAERALEAGDKLEALRSYSEAYQFIHESHAANAPETRAKVRRAITDLLADFHRSGIDRPFGEALCRHGQTVGGASGCWLCSLEKLEAEPSPAPLAKTSPDVTDDEILAAMLDERRPIAETIEKADEENLLKRKAAER